MKITRKQLDTLIKEVVESALNEFDFTVPFISDRHGRGWRVGPKVTELDIELGLGDIDNPKNASAF